MASALSPTSAAAAASPRTAAAIQTAMQSEATGAAAATGLMHRPNASAAAAASQTGETGGSDARSPKSPQADQPKKPAWVASYKPVSESDLKDLANASIALWMVESMSNWRNDQADSSTCAVFWKKVAVGVGYLLVPIVALIETVVRAIIALFMTPGFLGLLKDGPHNKSFMDAFMQFGVGAYLNLTLGTMLPYVASYHNATSGPVPTIHEMHKEALPCVKLN